MSTVLGDDQATDMDTEVFRKLFDSAFSGDVVSALPRGLRTTTRKSSFSVLGFWDKKHRDLRRCHAISPGFSGHYQDLGISSLTLALVSWF